MHKINQYLQLYKAEQLKMKLHFTSAIFISASSLSCSAFCCFIVALDSSSLNWYKL